MVRQQFDSYWSIVGISFSPQAVINLLIGLAVLAGLHFALYKTLWGRVMRAAAVNARGALLAGIPVAWTQWAAFLTAGALAGAAGILVLYSSGMDFAAGIPLTLKSLGAALLFGLGNPTRGFVGGVAIGVVEAVSVGYAPQTLSTLLPYLFIFAVLCTARMSRAGVAGMRG